MEAPTSQQLRAAVRLHRALPTWSAIDAALDQLKIIAPNFDLSACLIKTATLNSLYSTQIYAVADFARHVHRVLGAGDPDLTNLDLVRQLAEFTPTGGKLRRCVSFASKFCHFFVDANRFPIYDTAAREMLNWHLGADAQKRDSNDYIAYQANIERLRLAVVPTPTYRELDQYLWLAGMHRRWIKQRDQNSGTDFNRELGRVFASPTEEQRAAIEELFAESHARTHP